MIACVKRHVGVLLRVLFGVVWNRGLRELDVDGSRPSRQNRTMIRAIVDDRLQRKNFIPLRCKIGRHLPRSAPVISVVIA